MAAIVTAAIASPTSEMIRETRARAREPAERLVNHNPARTATALVSNTMATASPPGIAPASLATQVHSDRPTPIAATSASLRSDGDVRSAPAAVWVAGPCPGAAPLFIVAPAGNRARRTFAHSFTSPLMDA